MARVDVGMDASPGGPAKLGYSGGFAVPPEKTLWERGQHGSPNPAAGSGEIFSLVVGAARKVGIDARNRGARVHSGWVYAINTTLMRRIKGGQNRPDSLLVCSQCSQCLPHKAE